MDTKNRGGSHPNRPGRRILYIELWFADPGPTAIRVDLTRPRELFPTTSWAMMGFYIHRADGPNGTGPSLFRTTASCTGPRPNLKDVELGHGVQVALHGCRRRRRRRSPFWTSRGSLSHCAGDVRANQVGPFFLDVTSDVDVPLTAARARRSVPAEPVAAAATAPRRPALPGRPRFGGGTRIAAGRPRAPSSVPAASRSA